MKAARSLLVAMSLLATLAPLPARAGPFTDDLSKCLVASTTPADNKTLVVWMVSVITLHPDVEAMATLTPAQRDANDTAAAKLFERLLMVSCKAQAQQAVKYEGAEAFKASFSVLGQVAMKDLMTNPKVAEGLRGLGKRIDEKKVEEAFGPAK